MTESHCVITVPFARGVVKPAALDVFPFDPPLRSSKVAIVGFATETMGAAPYDDPECEVWILNMLHAHVPRWDRLWELHDRTTIEEETAILKRQTDHLGVLQAERTRPIYMTDAHDDIPMSRRFPVEILTRHIAQRCDKLDQPQSYFTSTFAFMLATAVLGILQRRRDQHVPECGEEIHVCGVEMLNGEEYAYQRSCAEFWCGYVLGHGIPLFIPNRSALLEADGMYGYAAPHVLEFLARQRAYLEARRDKAKADLAEAGRRRDQAMADVNTHHGTVQAFEHMLIHNQYIARGGKV